MADEELLHKIHGLGDLDLAALLSLISREHCIIGTESPVLDGLVAELQLVASHTFGLDSAVLDCTPQTTLDDLASAILVSEPHSHAQSHPYPSRTPYSVSNSPLNTHKDYYFHARHGSEGTGNTGPTASYGQMQQPPAVRPGFGYGFGYDSGNGGRAVGGGTKTRIASVIIAKNLDTAPKAVQIQCLELMRTRRLFTRTSVQAAPRQFLLVAVVATAPRRGSNDVAGRLTPHLNDLFYIAHWHDPEDGFAHLEERDWDDGDDDGYEYRDMEAESEGADADPGRTSFESGESVVRRSLGATPRANADARVRTPGSRQDADYYYDKPHPGRKPLFGDADLATLALAAREVAVDVDVLRYQQNVVSFLRLHRAVALAGPGESGAAITPAATRHLGQLARALAALHGLGYATPALVGLAARKVYLHRVRVLGPDALERERSMQWGSDLAAVEALLDGVGPEEVIADVLAEVAAPL
ncbi:hypothetical protein DL762_003952 [Monosporascus cannonballus]|uniref:Magnesium chelatase n=1 Tax=Monosporascus cannonballus TaxID=155416 RepID=A0ABY0H988_9PEZI|nr:hypothetical protein DL762_003952 [Monosporascus cannonballus]